MTKENRKSPFSKELCRAIAKAVRELGTDGYCISSAEVAKALKKTKMFTVEHPDILRLLVAQAVSTGAVPGLASRKGRDGGIYSVSGAERTEPATA